MGETFQALTAPTRAGNCTQIIRKDGMVSDTQRAVDVAGFNDALAYQVTKRTKEWKNDLEYNVITQTQATGQSGTARTMTGALSFITSVTSALASAELSETIYNDFMEICYNYGGRPTEAYVGSWLKRKISGFTAGANKNVDIKDKRLVNSVDVYESDFGAQKIFLCHDLNSTGASTAAMMLIDPQYWSLAYLRKPKYSLLPDDGGDRTRFKIIGEVTLECRAQDANAKITGLSNVE